MVALRAEADEAHEQVDELKARVKTLEQENLSKEQEITSLNHRNQLLEDEVEKAETALKEAKEAANQSLQHDTQNEALQRRVQLLEEEAEENDKTLRETNEKYDSLTLHSQPGADSMEIQASPNRHQGWSLRAEGAGTRGSAHQAGAALRGCYQGAQWCQEGAGRPRRPDGRNLSVRSARAGYTGALNWTSASFSGFSAFSYCDCLCYGFPDSSQIQRFDSNTFITQPITVPTIVFFKFFEIKRLCSMKLSDQDRLRQNRICIRTCYVSLLRYMLSSCILLLPCLRLFGLHVALLSHRFPAHLLALIAEIPLLFPRRL